MHRRSFLTALAAVGAPPLPAKSPIRVMAWSERSEPAEIYPNGINGALLQMLSHEKGIVATAADLADPDQGLAEEALRNTGVLIAFGHRHHKVVSDENVDRIVRRVEQDGMGYLPIHSSHYARAFQKVMTTITERRGAPSRARPAVGARCVMMARRS